MRDEPGVDNSMAAEEEENSKTFLFPVEEIQTAFNGDRTRLNVFIIIPTIDPCGTPIFLFF